MERRKIGSLSVTVVGIGCNNFGGRIDEKRTEEVVNAALDAGINFFDTADSYANGKSEELLGSFLAGSRAEAIIATKFGLKIEGQGQGARPEYIRKAFDASLRRLKTDYVDLYQLHTPDPDVPIAETLGALDELVKSGKAREIGCSNFSAEQLREARTVSDSRPASARFVSVQNEYSLLHREPEDEVLAECERQGLAFLPFFPLKSGLLTGKYRKGQPIPQDTRVARFERYRALLTEDNLDKVETLIQFAESRGHTLLELAFSWLLAHRVVASVIAGATSAKQVRDNAGAAKWKLTAADLEEIDSLLRATV
ncbi:MAG TPA: aldo/keto reductase [Gemmatimonadaceae bacterium]|nr:aldo/keto reductase [Gemmatimonadaceae bacterium]